jgi:hypothetical protein
MSTVHNIGSIPQLDAKNHDVGAQQKKGGRETISTRVSCRGEMGLISSAANASQMDRLTGKEKKRKQPSIRKGPGHQLEPTQTGRARARLV